MIGNEFETASSNFTNAVKYTSDDWCTPKWLAELLGEWDLDPCSNPRSHIKSKIRRYDGGLDADWSGCSAYCNPPYSDVWPWAAKLALHAWSWVALVKLDPTTKWWKELHRFGASWAPFKKRIKFERPDKPPLTANFPSALVWRDWEPSSALKEHLWRIYQA